VDKVRAERGLRSREAPWRLDKWSSRVSLQFLVLGSQFLVLSSQFSGKEGPEMEKAQARELAPIFTFYIYYSNLHGVIGT
jgi:hypothetical protein